jgi:hypothetical protein
VAEQNLDFNIIAHTQGMEQIANLINRVGALEAETKKLTAANTGLAKSTESVVVSGKRYNNAMDAQSKALRNSRMGVSQLGMQFNDLATSISTGASPAQAFNQQIGQIGIALSFMGGSVGALGRLIAGPLGIALIGATILLQQFKGETKENEKTTANFGDYAVATFQSIGEKISNGLQPAMEAMGPAISALNPIVEALSVVFENLGYVGKSVANFILRAFVASINAISILISNSFSMIAEGTLNVVNASIAGINILLAQAENRLNYFADHANKISGIFSLGFTVPTVSFDRLTPVVNKFAGTTIETFSSIGKAVSDTFKTDFLDFGDISKRAGKLALGRDKDKDKDKDKKGGKSEAEKALEKELKSQQDFMDKIAKVGMKELPSYQREIAELEKAFMELSKTGQKATIEPFRAAVESIEMRHYKDMLKEDVKEADKMVKDLLSDFSIAPVGKEFEAILDGVYEMNESFDNLGNAVANSFKGMVTGAMSFRTAMKGIIGAVIDELFRLYVVQQVVGVVKGALGGLFGVPTLPGKAVGGSVTGNKPYMVGERGPELFVPGGNGTIIPNQNVRGSGGGSSFNITVDARGSNDPAAVRAQVQQGILEAAPAIIAAAESRTISSLRRPRLGGVMQ